MMSWGWRIAFLLVWSGIFALVINKDLSSYSSTFIEENQINEGAALLFGAIQSLVFLIGFIPFFLKCFPYILNFKNEKILKINILKKITNKFNAKSLKHLMIIFLIFALSGSASLFISSSILTIINLKELIHFYPLYLLVRIIFLIPIYQLVLIIIATLFGEFRYFWNFEKKFFKRLRLIK